MKPSRYVFTVVAVLATAAFLVWLPIHLGWWIFPGTNKLPQHTLKTRVFVVVDIAATPQWLASHRVVVRFSDGKKVELPAVFEIPAGSSVFCSMDGEPHVEFAGGKGYLVVDPNVELSIKGVREYGFFEGEQLTDEALQPVTFFGSVPDSRPSTMPNESTSSLVSPVPPVAIRHLPGGGTEATKIHVCYIAFAPRTTGTFEALKFPTGAELQRRIESPGVIKFQLYAPVEELSSPRRGESVLLLSPRWGLLFLRLGSGGSRRRLCACAPLGHG